MLGTAEILAIISMVLLCLCVGVGLFEILVTDGPCITFLLGMGAVVCAMLSCQISKQEKVENLEQIKNAPEGYSFYLDGQDVDFEKIDLDQYDVSYDLEKKKVYLTRK